MNRCLMILPPQMLSEKNVRFYMNDNVTEIRGINGKVKNKNKTAQRFFFSFFLKRRKKASIFFPGFSPSFLQVKEVVLKSARVIPADVLIVGIGE